MVGVLVAVAWLVLPGMTSRAEAPVAGGTDGPVAGAAAQEAPEDSTAGDLALPLVAAAAAVAVAGYAYVRRSRRARTRTTPGGAPAPDTAPAGSELDTRAQSLLTEADNWVRTSREELSFALGRAGVEGDERALREAAAELASAFRMRQRYDDGLPEDDAGRQQVLAGIVGRCEEAGRRLDAEAAGFDQLRGLEGDLGGALAVAEGRFRELTARTGGAGATLVELDKRYGPAATAPVAGYVEQAKDRLVFATTRLNEARQGADLDATEQAIGRLRAAEAAIAQAELLVHGVERLAEDLAAAAALVPAALTGGETEIAGARERAARAGGGSGGPKDVRIGHADGVLADVREELTGGPYDPVEALRRIVRGVVPVADGRAGVVSAAAWLVARSSTAAADDHIATHRSAVGSAPRTRLAEARRLLASTPGLTDLLTTDALARRARELAEQDIRLRGAEPEPATSQSFGGPRTCERRG
ncbi:hypothetical protein [Streptomyces cinnabarinus]|uniref:hypothetical protein n=1 Tax=Streptomyces cinnabarinus TaxID=67287 RepID=UPI003AF16F5C